MKKEYILREIRRTAEANGGTPLRWRKFFSETGIREADWLGRFWARWSDAVREAGYTPNKLQGACDETVLLDKYVGLIRELGRIPVRGDLLLKARSDPKFPNPKTFDRLGSKSEIVERLTGYCRNRSGYEDVMLLCTECPQRKREVPESETFDGDIGFVYLMKSGRFYKIGRSNASGRREYELALQLPEKVTTVHTIRTDDPVGIEAYWHKRFEGKRKSGEWFELNSRDIAAFRRRKFM